MSQEILREDALGEYYYIFYREIRSDSTKLTEERFIGDDAEAVEMLLDDIFTNASGDHTLEELDTTRYFERWIEGSLDASEAIEPGEAFDNRAEGDLEAIAEDFSDDMQTRARAAGKYVVIILGEGRLITCHSYTGQRALTTEMEIIEELLSADNIDKYAEFTREEDEIVINHFDKYDTKSFVEWLGIPVDQVVYDIKGDVKIYSVIADDIQATFRFTRDDIVEKIINTDEFNLQGNLLETPDTERDYRIKQIRWGNSTYESAEEFKQEALTHHYELSYYEDKFDELAKGDLGVATKTAIDREERLTIESGSKQEVRVRKTHDDFEIVLVNEFIDLEAGWRQALASKALANDQRVSIHHPGNSIAEEPVRIGALRIYNTIGLDEGVVDDLHDFVRTARDLGTSNMGSLMKHVTFDLLRREANAPICHFFGELADEYLRSHKDTISEGTRVTLREGGPASVELKSPEWFYGGKDYELANKLTKELNNGAGMVVIGVDENGGKVKGIQKNRFPHERLEGLEKKVRNQSDATQIHVVPVPISGGDITITAMKTG
ncbi:hypothetical protein [Halocatena halophila]|uniref:hypothetical protein n=1 Tax=Halocatena halophila TaxID=2814576 RepID=UPI002ED5560B